MFILKVTKNLPITIDERYTIASFEESVINDALFSRTGKDGMLIWQVNATSLTMQQLMHFFMIRKTVVNVGNR